MQTLATTLLIENVAAHRRGAPKRGADELIAALGGDPRRSRLEPAFVAQALAVPTEADIAREIGATSIRTRSSPRAANCAPPSAAPSPARSMPPIGA